MFLFILALSACAPTTPVPTVVPATAIALIDCSTELATASAVCADSSVESFSCDATTGAVEVVCAMTEEEKAMIQQSLRECELAYGVGNCYTYTEHIVTE